MSSNCQDDMTYQMIILFLFIIIGCIQTVLCIISLYQVMQIHRKKHFTNLLLISQWIFYCSSLIFGISRICGNITWCFVPVYDNLTFMLCAVTYTIHWYALFILYSRLRQVFDDTLYQLNKTTVNIIQFTLGFLVVGTVAINILLGLEKGGVFVLRFCIGLLVVAALIVAQFLSFIFVYNLRKIHKETILSSNKLHSNKMLETVRKYSILSVISVMASTCYSITIFMAAFGAINYEKSLAALTIFLVLDVFIDTICMTLSLSVNDTYFRRICCIQCYVVSRLDHTLALAVIGSASPRTNDSKTVEMQTSV
eukprot:453209_1